MYRNKYNVAYIYATQVFEIRVLKTTSFDGGRLASVHTESIYVLWVYAVHTMFSGVCTFRVAAIGKLKSKK